MSKIYRCYTDGSCKKSEGTPGGWGLYVRCPSGAEGPGRPPVSDGTPPGSRPTPGVAVVSTLARLWADDKGLSVFSLLLLVVAFVLPPELTGGKQG